MQTKFTKEDYDSLNALKSEINLVDFACHKFGYIPDWDYPPIINPNGRTTRLEVKSSQNSIRLLHKDDTMNCVFIKKNPNGHYTYYSLRSKINEKFPDNGTIIDFVKNRYPDFTMSNFRKYAKNYISAVEKKIFEPINLSRIKNFGFNNLGQDSENQNYNSLSLANLKNLTDTSYLTKRGITEKDINKFMANSYNTLDTSGRSILVLPYYNTLDTEKGKILNLKTYQKYSDYDNTKHFASGTKDGAVWINSFDKTKKITSLVISENPLDSVSFAALNNKETGNNPVLTGTGGGFAFTTINNYNTLLEMFKNPKLILANDNDCAGFRYNAIILSNIKIEKYVDKDFLKDNQLLENTTVSIGYDSKQSQIKWDLSHNKSLSDNILTDNIDDNSIKLMSKLTDIRDYYLQDNQTLNKLYDKEKDTFIIETEYKQNVATVTVTFPTIKENWEMVNNSLLYLRFGDSEKITIEKSICKDFNDDLKVIRLSNTKPLNNDPELLSELVKHYKIDPIAEAILKTNLNQLNSTDIKEFSQIDINAKSINISPSVGPKLTM